MFKSSMANHAIAEEIGRRITQMRLEHNWTQQYVADEIGLSRISYARLEKGNCKLENLIATLRVFNRLDDLDKFIPDTPFSPMEMLKMKGKKRLRASGKINNDKRDGNTMDEGADW